MYFCDAIIILATKTKSNNDCQIQINTINDNTNNTHK